MRAGSVGRRARQPDRELVSARRHARDGRGSPLAVRPGADDVVDERPSGNTRVAQSRSIARSNAAAVTGWPDGGEKR